LRKHVLIIAEAGVNHNGDMLLAKKLIEAAAQSGADIVKFQTFNARSLVTEEAQKADYQKLSTDGSESQFEMLKRLELSPEMHYELIAHCKVNNIQFLSTGFDSESIHFLHQLGQTQFKVPSGEITNGPYLAQIGALGCEVILSTGMSTMNEIAQALEVLESAGQSRDRITVLHCTTEYPAPISEVNLLAMQAIGKEFGVKVGYSDHTNGIEVAIAAAALGATVIEKHFTLDRELPGPDHKASLEPDELLLMVNSIRNIELSLGDGIKKVTPSEAKNIEIARKSLVAAKPIQKGELFSLDNLCAKRPGNGISPMRFKELIGTPAKRSFKIDELIDL
jgi:N,N'-diacetyllegionaminate synthase